MAIIFNRNKMAPWIRDTYLLLCGKNAEEVKKYLYIRYVDKPVNMPYLHKNFNNPSPIPNMLARANDVIKKILDPYNIYEPIKSEQEIDIDFTDDEIDAIKRRK